MKKKRFNMLHWNKMYPAIKSIKRLEWKTDKEKFIILKINKLFTYECQISYLFSYQYGYT